MDVPKIMLLLVVQLTLMTLLLADEKEPVDGGWTAWSILSDSDCTAPCGGGNQTKVRTCTNPKPQNGGADCTGPSQITVSCNDETCDDKIANSEWGDWEPCSTTCGNGSKSRERKCVQGDDGFTCKRVLGKTFQRENCTFWEPFQKDKCPSTCDRTSDEYTNFMKHCPEDSVCTDTSNDMGPKKKCKCVMNKEFDSNRVCRPKPPVKPTPRPIPTLSPVEKVVAVVVTKTASTVLLVMVSLTLVLFLIMRVFTVDRVIQMNMEIAILTAHLLLLFPNDISTDNPDLCKFVSIGLHYFFTACFMFLLLESVHVYSMVAFVVTKNGLMNRLQNMLVGWGVPLLILIVSVCFFLDDYGAEYHCWTQMNKNLVYLVLGPVISICILNFLMLEASGVANYKPFKVIDHKQLLSCKIHQRSNLVLMPLILAAYILGMLSEYEQNLALYSVFSILNTVIGVCIFFFHSLGNQEVRQKVKSIFKCCFKSSEPGK